MATPDQGKKFWSPKRHKTSNRKNQGPGQECSNIIMWKRPRYFGQKVLKPSGLSEYKSVQKKKKRKPQRIFRVNELCIRSMLSNLKYTIPLPPTSPNSLHFSSTSHSISFSLCISASTSPYPSVHFTCSLSCYMLSSLWGWLSHIRHVIKGEIR